MKWLPREIAAPAYFAATNSSPKYCIGQKWPKGRPISTKLPLEEIQPEYDKHFSFSVKVLPIYSMPFYQDWNATFAIA